MAHELQAGAVTLLQLFRGETEFVSPLFQRRYVWTEKEIGKLWEDIDGILEGTTGNRFLGALVLETRTSGLAFKPDSVWIVDGQQRLSTLFMVLLRLAIEAERGGADDLAATIYKQYLFNQDGESKNRPKLQPTLLDYKQFNTLFNEVKAFTPRLEPFYGEDKGQLQKGYRIIEKAVRDRCVDATGFSPEKARALVSAFLEKLKFVQIVLGETQDPHQVFDSLNVRGVRLENADLIRNIVFEKLAAAPNEAEALYHAKWLPFEQSLGERLDAYFFPFGLIHKSTITKATLLGSLRSRFEKLAPNEIVEDLLQYVPAFNALTVDEQIVRQALTDSARIGELLSRLHRMRVPTTTFPFLLRLLRENQIGTIDEDCVVRNIRQLEAFIVRRALAGYEPTGLHSVFKDLWSRTNGDPNKFVDQIDDSAVVFPSDDQFRADIKAKPLYGRRLAGYILGEYERGLTGGDPVPDIEPTIDHVMPQELTPAWEGIVSAEDHLALKDVWANLVPLSMPANSEKGRKPWAEVKEYFLTETIFKTTKRLAQQNSAWNPERIRERGEQLALWAVNRWPKRA